MHNQILPSNLYELVAVLTGNVQVLISFSMRFLAILVASLVVGPSQI